jgi:hypothetical protein
MLVDTLAPDLDTSGFLDVKKTFTRREWLLLETFSQTPKTDEYRAAEGGAASTS